MALIFYDTETTGLSPFFDQILQFAAIKTDDDFNEIDRFNVRCRLLPHVVPHPTAMLISGVTAEMLTDRSLPSHYEMMTSIRAKLEEWGTAIYIGYNSLTYDEAMLRSAFYQTLHPTYLTNTNGSGRTDALRLMQAAYVFAPDALNIPQIEGKPSFKLENLAPENGFAHDNAHDALADVEATIFMTKKIAEAIPDIWRRLHAAAYKRTVQTFMTTGDAFLFTDFRFNKASNYPVAWIGDHPQRSSLAFAAVLDDNFDQLALMSANQLEKEVVKSPRPVRKIKTNASPLLTSFEKLAACPQFSALDVDAARQRAAILQSDDALRERLMAAMLKVEVEYEDDSNAQVEQRIYDGFYAKNDERRISDFHAASWPNRAVMAEAFEDERLKILAKRLIYVADPTCLLENDRREFEQTIAQRNQAEGLKPRWLTPKAALEAVEAQWIDATPTDRSILEGLRALYQSKAKLFEFSL